MVYATPRATLFFTFHADTLPALLRYLPPIFGFADGARRESASAVFALRDDTSLLIRRAPDMPPFTL